MKSILTEAENIVNGERATDYGSAKDSFNRIASITNLMLSASERELLYHDGKLCDTIVCKVLMAVKLSRESNKHKRDNLVDLCGYAELLNRIEDSEEIYSNAEKVTIRGVHITLNGEHLYCCECCEPNMNNVFTKSLTNCPKCGKKLKFEDL